MKSRSKTIWKYARILNLVPLYLFIGSVGIYAGGKSWISSNSAGAPVTMNIAVSSGDFSCNNFCGTFVRCLRDNGSLTAANEPMVPAIRDGCFSGCNKHQGMISSCYQGSGTACGEMVSCFQDRLRGVTKTKIAKAKRADG